MCVETTATRHVAGCLRGVMLLGLLSAYFWRSSRCWVLDCERCSWFFAQAGERGPARISRGRGAQRPAAPALPLTARYLFHHKSNLNAVVRPNGLQCVRWISNLANILRPLLASPPLPPTLVKLRHIPRRISSSTRIHKLGSRNQTTRSHMAVFLMAAKAPRSLTVCRVAP